jgi:hypothetical protein
MQTLALTSYSLLKASFFFYSLVLVNLGILYFIISPFPIFAIIVILSY